ncbi:unnamed protein product [Zymoseptoria tritici ST99CH_1A5]|uniref:Uncharacterized protein n=2 Tax=Zymoseptoria tritici TaxID=1047171 RepID=A0A1X7S4I0_ZYMT9|nr:unnamed protein product [Zymoseptoria tritici ST99CH_3D7]SMR61767.1 unnamed protein product [Zymoseptoria tritici ST99CH_3D1]SMY27988.1 unnamed protein product [Zymoseptoria tritici ST99CH_1A5]
MFRLAIISMLAATVAVNALVAKPNSANEIFERATQLRCGHFYTCDSDSDCPGWRTPEQCHRCLPDYDDGALLGYYCA